MADTRQSAEDRGKTRAGVEVASPVVVARGAEEDLRLDLSEAVDYAFGCEVRRARRPDSAECRRGQHGDDGLGYVGQVARNAVAGRHTRGAQCRGGSCDPLGQLGEGKAPAIAALVDGDESPGIVASPKKVFGEVQSRVWKPASARHLVAIHQCARARFADHLAVAPHQAPEVGRLFHGPLVEGVVAREVATRVTAGAARELRDLCALHLLGRGLPDRVVLVVALRRHGVRLLHGPASQSRTPARHAVMKVVSDPPMIERTPRRATSGRRSGAMPPMPPSRIASDPKLAKPQSA